ncbi:hypothetical protein JOC33_003371 [Thalassobacillus pellis]|nr:hypothetical protein [Thalassobacillus pellis]
MGMSKKEARDLAKKMIANGKKHSIPMKKKKER